MSKLLIKCIKAINYILRKLHLGQFTLLIKLNKEGEQELIEVINTYKEQGISKSEVLNAYDTAFNQTGYKISNIKTIVNNIYDM